MDYGKVFSDLIDMVKSLAAWTQAFWVWFNSNVGLSIFGYDILTFKPIQVLGGVGLTTLIVWWIVRG